MSQTEQGFFGQLHRQTLGPRHGLQLAQGLFQSLVIKKNTGAFNAWCCVLADTLRTTARCLQKGTTSAAPKFLGERLS